MTTPVQVELAKNGKVFATKQIKLIKEQSQENTCKNSDALFTRLTKNGVIRCNKI
jgi:hypothetical protein